MQPARIGNIPGFLGLITLMMLVGSVASFALSFEELRAVIPEMHEVRSTELALAEAERNVAVLAYPGNLTLSASPQMTVTAAEVPDLLNIKGSLSLSAPVGLASGTQSSLSAARAELARAREAVDLARADAHARLLELYLTAWLAQEQADVRELELELARAELTEARALFESGSISLSELTSVETTHRKEQATLRESQLERRLAWLELAYAAGIDATVTQGLDRPVLDPTEAFNELPNPAELTEWAEGQHPAVRQLDDRIARLREDLLEAETRDVSAAFQSSFSAASHTASVTYNFSRPTITARYAFPVATIGAIPGAPSSGSSDTWSIGVSMDLSLSSMGEERRATELLELQITAIEEQRTVLRQQLALDIRSRYQQYNVALDGVESAELAFLQAEETLAFAHEARQEERGTDLEILSAEAQLARARQDLATMRVRVLSTALATAAAASYTPELIPEGAE